MYNKKFYVRTVRLLLFILICSISFISCSKINSQPNSMGKASEPTPEPIPEKVLNKNVYIDNINLSGLKESEIRKKIEELGSKLNVEAKDAKLDERKWVVIEQEKSGKKVNVEKLLNSVMNAEEGANIKSVTETVPPGKTSQQLKNNIVEIGKFTTILHDKREKRLTNISIASKKLDMLKVAPGEQFSFNEALGNRTEEKGYVEAPIIIKTDEGYESGEGIGGGICQLSTTLYNAVEGASMNVIERHVHSKDINYVEKGKDATVSYGSTDFKFVNSRGYPVMIRVYMSKSSLTVKIFENRNY